jgi:dihydroorotate dehydrogenase
VQLGTVNFYDPTVAERIVNQLPGALQEAGVDRVSEMIGALKEA